MARSASRRLRRTPSSLASSSALLPSVVTPHRDLEPRHQPAHLRLLQPQEELLHDGGGEPLPSGADDDLRERARGRAGPGREQVEHGATPAGVVAERRIEHQDVSGSQRGDGVDGGDGGVRRISVPAGPAGAQQAGRSVVGAAAAEEQPELGKPLRRVRIRRVVGQVLRVERKRRALQRVARALLALAGRDLGGERDDGRLGLAGDEPVERSARIVEVVRAHRDVVPAGGDHGVRQLPAHALGDGEGRRVLEGGPARHDDEVRLALRQQALADLQEALPRDVVGRVAELGLEVEDVRGEPGAAQLGEELDQLRLDPGSVRPAAAVQRAGEHEQHARLLHVASCGRAAGAAASR